MPAPLAPAPVAPAPLAAAPTADALLSQLLDGTESRLTESLSGTSLDALIVAYGCGPDHIDGERLLVLLQDTPPEDAPGALISTHRALVRSPQRALQIRYDNVEGAFLDVGVGGPTVHVRRRGAELQWMGARSAPVVAGLLQGLVRLPPPRRIDPAPLLAGALDADLEPDPADPLGAAWALGQMRCMEPRLDGLLRLIPARVARGGLPAPVARQAVAGALLLERTLFGGRGQALGEWLSCLLPMELASVMVGVFGEGSATVDRAGVVRISWLRAPERGQVPLWLWLPLQRLHAWAGPRLGLPTRAGPLRVEAAISPAAWGCTLELLGARDGQRLGPLAFVAPDLLHALFAWLRDLEPEHLLQRVLLGLEAGPLDPARRPQMAEIAEQACPSLDVEVYFTPMPPGPALEHGNPDAATPARDEPNGPRRLPAVAAASIPTLRLQAAALQIGAGIVNFGWAGLAAGALLSLAGDGDGLLAQIIRTIAPVPKLLYALALVEVGGGLYGLRKGGAAPAPTGHVADLEVLSLAVLGLPSFLVGLAARRLLRRARAVEAGALGEPSGDEPRRYDRRREHFHPEDFDPADETWAWTEAEAPPHYEPTETTHS